MRKCLRGRAGAGVRAEEEGERGSSAASTLSLEPRGTAQSHGPEIPTGAKIRSQMLRRLSRPGAPQVMVFTAQLMVYL